jgi:hypothetical protein
MSSHHFVREGQEPALIIAAEAPRAHPLFDQLIAWNPVVITFDHIMPHLQASGINCDHLLATERQDDWKNILHEYAQVHICAPDEQPDMISRILASYDCRSARYLTDNENEFGEWNELSKAFDITILTPTIRWVYVAQNKFKKWLPKGVRVHIHGGGKYSINGAEITENILIESDGMYHTMGDKPFWWGESIAR